MKSFKIFGLLATVTALILSCVPQSIDPIGGKYPEKEIHAFTKGACEAQKEGRTHFFTMTMNDEKNNTLVLKFMGNKYYLPASAYYAATAENAKNGNYIIEASSYNGKALTESGLVYVTKNQDEYTITGNVWVEDGSVVAIDWKGTLNFVDDMEVIVLSKVLEANSNNNTVSLNLATDGIEWDSFDMSTFSNVYKGHGNYFKMDLYSADGYLHEGVYAPSAEGGNIGIGQFGIGWDPGDLYNMGINFTNWGTVLYTVEGTVSEPEKVSTGFIIVTRVFDEWTISWVEDGTTIAAFTGKIDALLNPADVQAKELTHCLSATADADTKTVKLVLASETGSWNFNEELGIYDISPAEVGYYLTAELYSEDGQLHEGVYSPSATPAANCYVSGHDGSNGACWWTVAGGMSTPQAITEGVITVVKEDHNWKISISNKVCQAEFVGIVELPKTGEDGFMVLTKLLTAQSNLTTGSKSVTINLGEDGIEVVSNGWGGSDITGNGHYLAIDLYSADGKIAAGTYVANSVGGVIGEGEFGIGYDTTVDWGFGPMEMKDWGTCWWTVVNGQKTAEKVLDGQITVDINGDTYTITLESTVINAKYVGSVNL